MNKKLERYQLEQFIHCINIPVDEITEDEGPDFLISTNGSKYGIEITSIRQNATLSAIAGNHRKIVQKACRKAIEEGMEPVDIKVWFKNNRIINVQQFINNASEYLYELIEKSIQVIKSANGNIIKIECKKNNYNINQITAHWHTKDGHKWLSNHRWQTQEPGYVSIDFFDILQNEISKKNKKIQDYLKKCSSCWLLIVVDRSKLDEHFDYEFMNHNHRYQSKFEKTYYFDLMENKVYQLITE